MVCVVSRASKGACNWLKRTNQHKKVKFTGSFGSFKVVTFSTALSLTLTLSWICYLLGWRSYYAIGTYQKKSYYAITHTVKPFRASTIGGPHPSLITRLSIRLPHHRTVQISFPITFFGFFLFLIDKKKVKGKKKHKIFFDRFGLTIPLKCRFLFWAPRSTDITCFPFLPFLLVFVLKVKGGKKYLAHAFWKTFTAVEIYFLFNSSIC